MNKILKFAPVSNNISKLILVFLLLVTVEVGFTQNKNPFASLSFDKVMMYDFEPGDKGGSIIEANGKLTKLVNKAVQLNKATYQKLNLKLADKKSFGEGTSSCFIPHLGFVYYAGNKVVGHISVCMACNRLQSNLDLPAQKQGQVGKGKNAYYMRDGMSKSFRSYQNGLLKQNKFSHQSAR